MVSFSCEGCGDVLTKKKLDGHRNQCRGATFTCLDCMVHFQGTEYRSHTSCISEAQKYQGHLYRPDKENKKPRLQDKRKSINGQHNSHAMIPKGAYVEDAFEAGDGNAVAIVEVPPRAPTPPPAPATLPESVNVFDFLVTDATPKANLHAPEGRKALEQRTPHVNGSLHHSRNSQYSNGDGPQYAQYGYSYGNAPLQPGFDRFDSWNNMADSQESSIRPPPYETPAPKEHRKEKNKRTGEKRKRNVEELDFSSVKRPQSQDEHMMDTHLAGTRLLHSGLTGGLSRLVTDQEFYDDRIDAGPTPVSPLKRSRRDKEAKDATIKDGKEQRRKSSYVSYSTSKAPSSKVGEDKEKRRRSRSPERERSKQHEKAKRSQRDDSFSSEDRSHVSRRKTIEYPTRAGSVQPTLTNSVVTYNSRADFFMSLVTKGNDSERGYSMNKLLKRYHRDLDLTRSNEKEDEDKELWKSIRLRRNSRGEIVLFA